MLRASLVMMETVPAEESNKIARGEKSKIMFGWIMKKKPQTRST
jgi:hypothetical protein